MKCHANMKIAYHCAAAGIAVASVALAAPAARADDAPVFGLSVDVHGAPALDRSIHEQETGRPFQTSRGLVGLAAVLNWDALALGVVVDGMPGLFGNGRLSTGGLVGWQPRMGTHLYQVLGEMGQERFSDVGGGLLSTADPRQTWLPYVGARLGLTETFSRNNPFELGAWLFIRQDVGEATVTSTPGNVLGGDDTVTQYRLGGYSAGLALRVGVRFDQKRPANRPTVEVSHEPAKS